MFKTIACITNVFIRPNLSIPSKVCSSLLKPNSPWQSRVVSKSSSQAHVCKENVVKLNIIEDESRTLPKIVGSNVELSDVSFEIGQEKFVLNLTSLRDFCFCSQCIHPNSRQKLFTPKDFRRNKFSIRQMRIVHPTGDIIVEWIDGHESVYPIEKLRKMKRFFDKDGFQWLPKRIFEYPDDDYYKPSRKLEIERKSWNVECLTNNISTVNYESLVGDSTRYDKDSIFNANKPIDNMTDERCESMYSLTKSLVTYGVAKIVNVPKREQEILNVARCLAYERPTGYGTIFDVVVEPSDEINLAYSALEFDLHTDLPYRESMPGVQLLHCITNSQDGGESYFSDGYTAAKKLEQEYPQLFQVLTEFPTTFSVRDPYRDVKFRRQHPIVSLDYQNDIHEIHYSPFHLPPLGPRQDVKMFYLALDKFTQYLQSKEQKLITKMDPGDLYIFHNRRVLHGRSSYDPAKSVRFLQGCYMDWDEIQALYEKLHKHRIKLEEMK